MAIMMLVNICMPPVTVWMPAHRLRTSTMTRVTTVIQHSHSYPLIVVIFQ